MKLLPQIKIREERFGLLIFDKEREKFFITDEVGKNVLAAIESTTSIDEAVEQLSLQYEATGEVIKQDVISFIEEMIQAGLMRWYPYNTARPG
jgi:hypothetical protein